MRRRLPAVIVLLAALLPVRPAGAANDPLQPLQWGLAQVRAPAAWTYSTGAGVRVAIVDSGVDLAHPDLAPNIVGGATFVGCADRPDGCGDGSYTSGGDTREPSGHGTHVAGIVAAARNGLGISGVAPDADILSVKVLRTDAQGQVSGTTTEVAAGIRWAVRHGAEVINLSLSAGPASPALTLLGSMDELRAAVRDAVAAGVVVVAAAGNESAPLCGEPAFDPQVICVVATTRDEGRAPYSNLALDQSFNVLAAPGGLGGLDCAEDVLSTYPTAHRSSCRGIPGGYEYLAGTSMAAPHVAGVAALLLAQGRQPSDVVRILRETARTPGSGARGQYTLTYGWGIVDAAAAVAVPIEASIVERVAGDDRTATAAAISARTHLRADEVVLARADDPADALAGAPFAALVGGPLLLTARDQLSPAARDEIVRLGARRVWLLGGTDAIGPAVERTLREELGVTVERIAGEDRFDTAARVADRFPAGEVIVALGWHPDPQRSWPDALSGGALGAGVRRPVLLVTPTGLPAATAARLHPDTDVLVIGGEQAISPSVVAAIDARARTVRRLAGADRYGTSAAVVAEAEARGLTAATTWVATGRAFPDGLAAGAAAGSVGGVLVLVDGADLDGSPATRDLIADRSPGIEHLLIAGGVAAVSGQVERDLRALVEG